MNTVNDISATIGANVVPLIFPVIACIGALIAVARRKSNSKAERLDIWLRWWFCVAVGFGALWIAIGFMIAPNFFAESVGFPATPYQFEVAVANLAFAFIGFACVIITDHAREVSMIGYLIFLVGAAYGHIFQFLVYGNTHPGNFGTIILVDIAIPVIALLLLRARRRVGIRKNV